MPVRRRVRRRIRKGRVRTVKGYGRVTRNVGVTMKSRAGTVIGRTLGFPKIMKFRHRYVATHLITSTTGVLQSQSYAANGLFDPDITGAGHQPMYFDQLAALYNHYLVIGSRMSVKVVPATSTAQVPMRFIAWINDANSTVPSTVDAIAESKFAKQKILGGPNSPSVQYLNLNWSAKRFFGGSVMANDELKANIGNNPAEVSYYFLSLQAMDASTTVSVQVIVTIDYIALWRELKEIESS